MDSKEFSEASAEVTKYITGYLDNIRDRRVLPEVSPGYLRALLPEKAPDTAEDWRDVLKDVEKVIMPGVTHWQSPHFHAFYPAGNSYPSLLADMLCGAIGCIGFTWIASPACTELEVVMMDWLAELLGLPNIFMAKEGGNGGGVIQGTASEATLVALLSAKNRMLKSNQQQPIDPTKLVAYTSDQSHCSVERAGMLAGVIIRLVPSDHNFSMRGTALRSAVESDVEKGLAPFFVVPTLGTTSSCAFDPLGEICAVAKDFNMWTHVDAAYAGSAFVCEEFRYLMEGIEHVDSFNFNPHKWLLINFDCSAMWVKNSSDVVDAFNVDPIYLRHDHQGEAPDYRHWQIPLGRRFRSLKLWFTMRIYGKKGLQSHIRKQVCLAKQFEALIRSDCRFEIFAPVTLGLVCFRIKGSNEVNESLLKALNESGTIYLVPSKINDIYFIRFAVCSRFTESCDVKLAFAQVQKHASIITNNGIAE